MSFSFLNSLLLQRLSHPRLPMLIYAVTWTALLTVTVAVASFSPELAFVSVIRPASSLSLACRESRSVRLPLDVPSEIFCFPGRVLKRSRIDMVVPPVFAAVIVAGSAFVVKALGLWEVENNEEF
ncbi:hypothetical protein ACJIZ3_024149 [Penstemon smallii]|uniref:Transmembrane protein n=1 Tax=Penstemon smallii TaxID=265156 RepID=A0ABD3TT13_9LAMI